MDVSSRVQRFLEGHSDDITVLSVNKRRDLALTGQMGARSCLSVWSLNSCNLLRKVGFAKVTKTHGVQRSVPFYERWVCAACFTHDSRYVIGVGCNDSHMLAVWHIGAQVRDGTLVLEMPAQNGSPPKVYGAVASDKTALGLVSTGGVGSKNGCEYVAVFCLCCSFFFFSPSSISARQQKILARNRNSGTAASRNGFVRVRGTAFCVSSSQVLLPDVRGDAPQVLDRPPRRDAQRAQGGGGHGVVQVVPEAARGALRRLPAVGPRPHRWLQRHGLYVVERRVRARLPGPRPRCVKKRSTARTQEK
jgi:hypothetical protein